MGEDSKPITNTIILDQAWREAEERAMSMEATEGEYTGGSVNYYKVKIDNPTTEGKDPYEAECNDIIEALEMTYAEANVVKAVWRIAAARKGLTKKSYVDGVYDAEKSVFFSERILVTEVRRSSQ